MDTIAFFYFQQMKEEKAESIIERPFELERLVFFSDAVFAIAITLLAIELHVPELEFESSDALLRGVLSEWPRLLAFSLSFWIIAVYWVAHHRYFRYIVYFDDGLLWRNLVLLFTIALIPFTSSILGEYGNMSASVWLYAVNMIALGLSGAWMWRHATKGHRLVASDLDDKLIRQIQGRAFATPLAGVIVIGLTFVLGGFATIGFMLIFVFQMLVMRRYK